MPQRQLVLWRCAKSGQAWQAAVAQRASISTSCSAAADKEPKAERDTASRPQKVPEKERGQQEEQNIPSADKDVNKKASSIGLIVNCCAASCCWLLACQMSQP